MGERGTGEGDWGKGTWWGCPWWCQYFFSELRQFLLSPLQKVMQDSRRTDAEELGEGGEW